MADTKSDGQTDEGTGRKGLNAGSIGLLGAVVLGVSCVAPAYTLAGAMGPVTAEVGYQVPAILLAGFVPMLLVAVGYYQLNRRMPDSGTTFTWATKAFGPWLGWLGGWGMLASTILVISSLASIAVDYLYLMLSQIFGDPRLAGLADNMAINIVTCLVFIVITCYIAYRGLDATTHFQYALVAFQVIALVLYSGMALYRVATGTAFDGRAPNLSWFNVGEVESVSAFAAGIALSAFLFWGWDTVLTLNEETKESTVTPGRAAAGTIVAILAIYLLTSMATLAFAGIGDGEYGLTNPDFQDNVFLALATPVMGPLGLLMSLAVLASSVASLQSTFVSPARTMLAMGYYRALPKPFARVSPSFHTPSVATVASGVTAGGLYVVLRLASENVLWDTITALGIMVCFYYGLTSLAAAAYFRTEAFTSVRNFVTKFLCPGLGGLMLLGFFLRTWTDAMKPEFGSGSQVGGVGLVFILGLVLLGVGIVLMILMALLRPDFFRGRVVQRGTAAGTNDDLALGDLTETTPN